MGIYVLSFMKRDYFINCRYVPLETVALTVRPSRHTKIKAWFVIFSEPYDLISWIPASLKKFFYRVEYLVHLIKQQIVEDCD